MSDIVDPATRSRMMSSIRSKNTKPELAVRRYLHGLGFRYQLHRKDLPGKPDLVFPKHHLVLYVHGCFWHRHEHCFYATTPASRPAFWKAKFDGNAERDHRQQNELYNLGWRVLVIWECGIRHTKDKMHEIPSLILGDELHGEWPLKPPRQRK